MDTIQAFPSSEVVRRHGEPLSSVALSVKDGNALDITWGQAIGSTKYAIECLRVPRVPSLWVREATD